MVPKVSECSESEPETWRLLGPRGGSEPPEEEPTTTCQQGVGGRAGAAVSHDAPNLTGLIESAADASETPSRVPDQSGPVV